MTRRAVLIALRLPLGLLALVAIARQFSIQVQLGFSALNFFSYFTNLSNLFAAVVLVVSALHLITRREPSASDDLIRGAAVVCLALVGIVFTVLLRNVDLGHLVPWVNVVLHYVMPVALVLDWLYQPPRTRLRTRQMLLWQVFPLAYLAYVLIRGSVIDWYPYPFLNPTLVGGYGGVAVYVLGIVAVFLFVSWSVLTLGNRLHARTVMAPA